MKKASGFNHDEKMCKNNCCYSNHYIDLYVIVTFYLSSLQRRNQMEAHDNKRKYRTFYNLYRYFLFYEGNGKNEIFRGIIQTPPAY